MPRFHLHVGHHSIKGRKQVTNDETENPLYVVDPEHQAILNLVGGSFFAPASKPTHRSSLIKELMGGGGGGGSHGGADMVETRTKSALSTLDLTLQAREDLEDLDDDEAEEKTSGGGPFSLVASKISSVYQLERAIRCQLRLLDPHPGVHLLPLKTSSREQDNAVNAIDEGLIFRLRVKEMVHNTAARGSRIQFFKDLVLYVLFFICYIIFVCMLTDINRSFQVTDGVTRLITNIESANGVTFETMKTPAEYFDFLETGLLPSVFAPETHYSGRATTDEEYKYLNGYTQLVAGIRMLQHRVNATDACLTGYPRFCEYSPVLWPLDAEDAVVHANSRQRIQKQRSRAAAVDVGAAAADNATASGTVIANAGQHQDSFGPPWDPLKYVWRPDDSGQYEGGGYSVLLPLDKGYAVRIVRELRQDEWVSKLTRRVYTDAVIYHASYRVFVLVQFDTQFLQTGVIRTKLNVDPVNLERSVAQDVLIIGMFIIVAMWTVTQTVTIIYRWLYEPYRLGSSSGSRTCFVTMRLILIILLFFMIGYTLWLSSHPLNDPDTFKLPWPEGKGTFHPNRENIQSFPGRVFRQKRLLDVTFFTGIFLIANLFFYLLPFPEFGIFIHTVTKAGTQLAMYALMMIVLIFFLAVIGFYTFGPKLEEWSTLEKAMQTTFIIVAFEYDYERLSEGAGEFLGLLYFDGLLLVMQFVIFNVRLRCVRRGRGLLLLEFRRAQTDRMLSFHVVYCCHHHR